jgi:hypothetical protein
MIAHDDYILQHAFCLIDVCLLLNRLGQQKKLLPVYEKYIYENSLIRFSKNLKYAYAVTMIWNGRKHFERSLLASECRVAETIIIFALHSRFLKIHIYARQ